MNAMERSRMVRSITLDYDGYGSAGCISTITYANHTTGLSPVAITGMPLAAGHLADR